MSRLRFSFLRENKCSNPAIRTKVNIRRIRQRDEAAGRFFGGERVRERLCYWHSEVVFTPPKFTGELGEREKFGSKRSASSQISTGCRSIARRRGSSFAKSAGVRGTREKTSPSTPTIFRERPLGTCRAHIPSLFLSFSLDGSANFLLLVKTRERARSLG